MHARERGEEEHLLARCPVCKTRERMHQSLTKTHKIRVKERQNKDDNRVGKPFLSSRFLPFFFRRRGIDEAFKCQPDKV